MNEPDFGSFKYHEGRGDEKDWFPLYFSLILAVVFWCIWELSHRGVL